MGKGFWEQTFKVSCLKDEPVSFKESLDISYKNTDLLAKEKPILGYTVSDEMGNPGEVESSQESSTVYPDKDNLKIEMKAFAPEPAPSVNNVEVNPACSDIPLPGVAAKNALDDLPGTAGQKHLPESPNALEEQYTGTLISRVKAKSGPHKLDKLGDFLNNIWMNVNLRAQNHSPRTLVLCGANRGVGATFISFHLALALSQERNLNVLYVDASMDTPNQPFVIPQLENSAGLASFFGRATPIESVIHRTEFMNLSVVPSGVKVFAQNGNGSGKARSVKEFIDYCSAYFDVTIIDGPPPMEHPNTIAFAKVVDKTILVCRYGISRREVYKHTIDKLKENGVSIAGAIINERQYPLPESVYKLLK